jgi:HTH-type transcriptional regulator/antitoxin HipB
MQYVVKTPRQLGQVLRGFRTERGLTQATLGASIGIAQNEISDFERDAERATIRKLFRMLSGLGVEIVLRDPAAPANAKSRRRASPEW